MIPRALPSLASDAIRCGWTVNVHRDGVRTHAYFNRARGYSGVTVHISWRTVGVARPVLEDHEINGTATPYTQCTSLIRSPEGA